MAKVLFAPDLHYGYDNFPGRVDEWRGCADALVALVKEHEIDVVLMPGDGFTSGKHSPQAIVDVYGLYRGCQDAGAQVVGTFGNHDYTGADRLTPVHVLALLGEERWGITTPQIVNVGCRDFIAQSMVQVAVLPWVKATALLQDSDSAGDMNMRASAALVDIVRGLAAGIDQTRPAILMGHWPVAGCVMSSRQILHGGEPAIPLGELQAGPWSAVMMGHIHKRQQFPGSPMVMHAGALTRRDSGEELDDCGCSIFDTDTGAMEFHPLPAREFFTWVLAPDWVSLLVSGERSAARLLSEFECAVQRKAKDAVCRVKYRCTEEQHRLIEHAALIQALDGAGAYHVAGVFPEIIRSERTRANVTEETSPGDALGQWLDLRPDLSPDLKQEVLVAFDQLMREVE